MLHATRTALFRRLTWLAGLGVAGASLLVLSMTAAAAGPDGRRLTLGANGPTAQAPAAMPMQSDQMVSLAAMSPPPAARATEVVRIQDMPASAEQPAIRVAPTTPRIEASGPTAKAEPVTPKAVPVCGVIKNAPGSSA